MTLSLPKVLPPSWTQIEEYADPVAGVWSCRSGLYVLADITKKDDGKLWLHVSFSRKSRIPCYQDITQIKDLFMRDLVAIQIFPRPENHVNIHPNCLHLWACEDQALIPEMSKGGMI